MFIGFVNGHLGEYMTETNIQTDGPFSTYFICG